MTTIDEPRMLDHFTDAARRYEVTPTGTPRIGQDARSASTTVTTTDGTTLWLRLGREHSDHINDPTIRDFWTGIPDSTTITGIPRPDILNSATWDDGDWCIRADLMTHLPGTACAPTEVLRVDPGLTDQWWTDLRDSLNILRDTPTTRYPTRCGGSDWRVRHVFGADIADRYAVTAWETAHSDLHWANILAPEFAILDWELWGPNCRGKDPATLYLYALLVPSIANRVWDTFRDVLTSRDGQAARINVASRILRTPGINPDLVHAVRTHITPLLA